MEAVPKCQFRAGTTAMVKIIAIGKIHGYRVSV